MKKQLFFDVAEYIRLSREDGDKAESDSIGNQRKLITDYFKGKDDFALYDTYGDDDICRLYKVRRLWQVFSKAKCKFADAIRERRCIDCKLNTASLLLKPFSQWINL